MGPADSEAPGAVPTPAVSYLDVDGLPTDDPAAAVRGEITEFDGHGRPRRLTRFFLDDEQLPWLPVSEASFLLWVLIALIVAWLAVGLILGLV